MAASVLNAPRAVEMSVFVVRAFVALREAAAGHRELKLQLEALEPKNATTVWKPREPHRLAWLHEMVSDQMLLPK
jgi:hypothetical protein